MKEQARKLSAKQWLWFAAILAATVLANWWTMLYSGDGADIYAFRRWVRPLSVSYIPELFSPYWGWAYRPTFLLYYAAALRLFGANPLVLHTISLLLHLIVILLSTILVRRLFKNDLLALLSAALFALGTWNSQAVSWICSTSTLFATIAYLLALHCWLSWRRRGNIWNYVATLLFCIIGFASKEDAYVIPAALLLMDYLIGIQIDRKDPKKLLAYLPVAVALAVFIVLSNIASRNLTAIQTVDVDDVKIVPIALHISPAATLRAMQGALLGVLESYESSINLWGVALVGFYCWKQDRRSFLLFLWTFVVALPVPLVSADSATRFRYLPMITGAALIAHLLQTHWHRLRALAMSPLNLAIMTGLGIGFLRATFFSSAGDFAEFDAPAKPLRDYLSSGFPLVPVTLCICVLLAYGLWKARVLSQDILLALIIVAGGSQLSVWTSALLINPMALAAPAAAFLLSRDRSWKNILLVVALWELPVLTLPMFLLCYSLLIAYQRRSMAGAEVLPKSEPLPEAV